MKRFLPQPKLLLLLCLVTFLFGACAQSNQEEVAQMRREIDELKAQQQQILEQLRELKGDEPAKSIQPARQQLPLTCRSIRTRRKLKAVRVRAWRL